MLDSTFVSKIADLQRASEEISPRLKQEGELLLSTTALHQIHPDKLPAPSALVITTLAGIVAYVRENRDKLDLATLAVLVKSPDDVQVVGPLTGYNQQRFVYAQAKPEGLASFAFGQYHDLERAVIALRSQFTSQGDRDYLVGILGTVVADSGVTREDDGFTQSVTARAGIRLVGTTAVKPTVELAPFRTFTEVNQPSSDFVLRLQQQDGHSMKVALFEADGGAWRREAIARIRGWLVDALAEKESTAEVPVVA